MAINIKNFEDYEKNGKTYIGSFPIYVSDVICDSDNVDTGIEFDLFLLTENGTTTTTTTTPPPTTTTTSTSTTSTSTTSTSTTSTSTTSTSTTSTSTSSTTSSSTTTPLPLTCEDYGAYSSDPDLICVDPLPDKCSTVFPNGNGGFITCYYCTSLNLDQPWGQPCP